jgi:hypothetical protein
MHWQQCRHSSQTSAKFVRTNYRFPWRVGGESLGQNNLQDCSLQRVLNEELTVRYSLFLLYHPSSRFNTALATMHSMYHLHMFTSRCPLESMPDSTHLFAVFNLPHDNHALFPQNHRRLKSLSPVHCISASFSWGV